MVWNSCIVMVRLSGHSAFIGGSETRLGDGTGGVASVRTGGGMGDFPNTV